MEGVDAVNVTWGLCCGKAGSRCHWSRALWLKIVS